MIQEERSSSAVTDQSADAAVAPARQRGGLLSAPILGGICCLGLLLFLIASTIVLSLIPVYTRPRHVDAVARQEEAVFDVPIEDGNLPQGELNDAQKATLQQELQSQLDNDPNTRGSTVEVLSAEARANTKRKRQTIFATFIRVRVIFRFIRLSARRFIINLFAKFVLPLRIVLILIGQATTTTTTVATTTSANSSRVLVRRSTEEGGAPAGITYIDSHQLAGTNGLVSTVSFYVDRTCALSTIEFGAFDLTNRNVDTNNAELRLTHRSGPIKLDVATNLKPYMSFITIELCNENAAFTPNGGVCKGTKFPILAHQYIGIRSDSCRLGFAPTPINRVLATTWKPTDESDPFAAPYKTVSYIPSDYTVLQSVTIEPQNNEKVKENVMKSDAPRVLFIGSYPPRQCGLAKFLQDLVNSYAGPYDVVAVDEQGADIANRIYSDKVVYRLNQTDRDAYIELANSINKGAYDVVNIQHEYGLYGGHFSEYVLLLLSSIRKPVITTLHTVIPEPNAFIIGLTRAVCALSTRVTVMADLGRRLLIDVYGIDESKIVLIRHGVPDQQFDSSLDVAKAKLGIDANVPTMSTFGLIHRNKNIQYALKAMQTVVKSVPNMMYLVIGQTHPIVQKYEGESYRNELEGNVSALGLSNNVRFINKYADDNELLDYLAASDIYLTPYSREDQYVSGTLSWAVGLGKAVVSTPYLYAKELLADGRGFLVPFTEDTTLGDTIVKIVQDERVRNVARRQAYRYGRQMTWSYVSQKLEQLFHEVLLFT